MKLGIYDYENVKLLIGTDLAQIEWFSLIRKYFLVSKIIALIGSISTALAAHDGFSLLSLR